MKTCKWLIALIVPIVVASSVQAQCANGIQSITYDTLVTGSGNSYYNFTFPKFDATLGTLLEVAITSEVTLGYNFQLENRETSTVSNFRVRVYRDDEFSGSALQTPIVNNYYKQYGYYSLAGTDYVPGSGPDFISVGPVYVLDHSIITDTVYNTADFLGSGTVTLDYMADSYAAVLGGASVTFNGSAADTIAFSINYRYCNTAFLDADIISFTARKKEDIADLEWISVNEKTNRIYELQKSADGKNFTGVAKFHAKANANATGTYRHQYPFQSTDPHKLIFRLKQTDPGGEVKYSGIRVVETNKKTNRIRLYPNPTTGASTLLFNNKERGDWEVEVYSLSMQLLKKYRFTNTLLAKINTANDLKKGMYIIKAVSKSSGIQHTERLIVQ